MELPEDYQKGFKDFLGIRVGLLKRPLIPREETEYWVKIAIEDIKKRESNIDCLDIFSGSGCIGLAILKNTKASCDFGEIDKLFLEQIQINLNDNKIDKDKYNLIKTDIFSNINKSYDYILANPPYVAEKRRDEVGDDVKMFEPSIALFSGENGMDVIKVFLKEAKNYLKEEGRIYMEFDEEQKNWIKDIIKENYSSCEFLKDQFEKYRFVIIEK